MTRREDLGDTPRLTSAAARIYDWRPDTIVSPTPRYAYQPTGPVLVSVIKVHGEVWGYLWADDAGDAAKFLPARDAGEPAANLTSDWLIRLCDCKGRGLKPSEALAEIVAAGDFGAGAGPIGGPVPYEQLQKLAGPPIWEQPNRQERAPGRG